jgi:hypothetical protein
MVSSAFPRIQRIGFVLPEKYYGPEAGKRIMRQILGV